MVSGQCNSVHPVHRRRGSQAVDERDIDDLIVQHARPLMRYLLHLTHREDAAQDLFQETWIRVLLKKHQLLERASFRAWLFSIARNATFDELRRRQHLSLELLTETQSNALSSSRTGSDPIHNAQERLAIFTVLKRLTPHYRRVMLLRFYCDMTLEEISIETRAPLSTVKGRLYRGLRQMRVQWAHVPTAENVDNSAP